MANILTAAEAASALRCEVDDPLMLILLNLVDAYINYATGKDWTAETEIHPMAKDAAITMLVRRHEDPGAMGQMPSVDDHLRSCLVQLEAIALEEQ